MIFLKDIQPFSLLKGSDISYIDELTSNRQYKKDSVLVRKGEVANNLIFLKSGIVSSVYDEGRKKFIRDFYFSPLIFTEQESFIKRIPAKFSVICITNIDCQIISHESLEKAYNHIPKLREVAFDLLFIGFVNVSNRLESLLTLNPEKRYIKLLKENPKLLQSIPLKMIASYLGITDVALSRIRKRISVSKINNS